LGSSLPFAAFANKINVKSEDERPLRGQTGLMHSRLLLAQHFFAVAAHHIWQRSIFHQSSRSN
jgi:hypothetical protein